MCYVIFGIIGVEEVVVGWLFDLFGLFVMVDVGFVIGGMMVNFIGLVVGC